MFWMIFLAWVTSIDISSVCERTYGEYLRMKHLLRKTKLTEV